MKSTKKTILHLLAFILAANVVFSQTAPDPIENFEWQQLPFINAQIARPKDWFFTHSHVVKEKRHLYLLAMENVQMGLKLRTGMEIRVIEDVRGKTKIDPSKYAEKFISEAREKTPFEKDWSKQRGVFAEKGFIRKVKSSQDSFKEYFIALANDKTGTIYLISFTAPIDEWDNAWKIGELIFKNIYFDDKL